MNVAIWRNVFQSIQFAYYTQYLILLNFINNFVITCKMNNHYRINPYGLGYYRIIKGFDVNFTRLFN